MKDVARASGYSISTISHVINNSRNVDPETRAKIEAAIEQLDYRPNAAARSLRSNRSRLLGIVVPNIREAFFTDLVKELESLSADDGLSAILCDSEDNLEKELKYLETLIENGVDAIVICPTSDNPEHYAGIHLGMLPVVQVDRKVPGLGAGFVGIDSYWAIRMAVQHMHENGARDIAFVGYKVDIGPHTTINYSMAQLAQAFARVAGDLEPKPEARHIMIEYRYAPVGPMREKRVAEIAEWLRANPNIDSVVCGNQTVCHEVLLAVTRLGWEIPDDLFVLSLGDNQWLPLLRTPITATQQPIASIAQSALDIVRTHFDSNEGTVLPASETRHRSELVVRASTQVGRAR